jgi:hypothetical protein
MAHVKKEGRLISVGPQFHTLLAATGALIAELRRGRKKNRLTQNVAGSLSAEAAGTKRRMSGKLKVERL